jgi:hypothetical protein
MTGIGQDPDGDTVRTYCVEPAIQRALARSATADSGPRYSESWIDYISLSPGATGRSP